MKITNTMIRGKEYKEICLNKEEYKDLRYFLSNMYKQIKLVRNTHYSANTIQMIKQIVDCF